MPPDQIFVCLVVLATVVAFVWDKWPPDLVSMGALFLLVAVPFNGHPILLPPSKADQLAILGAIFGNNAVLTVTFMFIVGAAVERTGLVDTFGQWFHRIAGGSERRALLSLGLIVVPASGFLNNTTVVVVMLPMIMGLCRQTGISPSRLLIPLSYFAIAGGICTIIGTSTNLVSNGIMQQKGLAPFSMFDITPLGVCLALIVLVYLMAFGKRLLPERACLATLVAGDEGREYLTAAIVSTDSPLVGRLFTETPLARMRMMRVIEVRRAGTRLETPLSSLRFEAGDRLILSSHLSGMAGLNDIQGIELAARSELGLSYVRTEKAVLTEAMLGPNSRFIGSTLKELLLRQHFGVLILAVHRHGTNLRQQFEETPLEIGDTLLLEGTSERLQQIFEERDVINLSQPKPAQERRLDRSWLALTALGLVVLLGAVDVMPFEWVALASALLVTLGRCLRREEIYEAVEWPVITMILGTLALGVAMDRSGAAQTLVRGMLHLLQGWPPEAILSAVLLATILLTELLGNNAVAALLTPLAIQIGLDLGIDPRPFALAVMVGASIGFAIPTGYQTHMLVFSSGGYRFGDFARAGMPLDLLLWVAGSFLIPLFWPLH